MNAKNLIVAVAVFAVTGSVFANDVNPFPDQERFVPKKTRAEVRAELEQARKQGWTVGGEEPGYPVQPPFVSTKTRAEVLADLEQARKQGWVIAGEQPNYPE